MRYSIKVWHPDHPMQYYSEPGPRLAAIERVTRWYAEDYGLLQKDVSYYCPVPRANMTGYHDEKRLVENSANKTNQKERLDLGNGIVIQSGFSYYVPDFPDDNFWIE